MNLKAQDDESHNSETTRLFAVVLDSPLWS